jgi:hypothetical protein
MTIKILVLIFVFSHHLVTLGVFPSNQISLLQFSDRGDKMLKENLPEVPYDSTA